MYQNRLVIIHTGKKGLKSSFHKFLLILILESVFNILNSSFCLFRYEVLADPNRKLVPWWTLNLGEPLVDMQVVTTQGSKAAILLLGERNLYCLREGGGVDLVKRLQYTPSCLHPYVTGESNSCFISHVKRT